MKTLRSFKTYRNLYSKTYSFSSGSFKDMSYMSYNCKADMNSLDLHHSKQRFMICTTDAYGTFRDVKYVTGLVNAKKLCLELYNRDNLK